MYSHKDNKVYDRKIQQWITMPFHLKMFYKDLNELCRKYNLSISHEDSHGEFIIENYHEGYMEWLMDASLCANIEELPEELSWLDEYVQ